MAIEEYPGGVFIIMRAKDQRVEAMEEEAQGGEPLFRWRRSAIGRGIIAVVIVFIKITIIMLLRGPLSAPRCNPYLNMVLYATYYDPMMCCQPMMF